MSLIDLASGPTPTIVGITASESLSLCVLKNRGVEVQRTPREEDVVDVTLKALPNLVSLSVGTVGVTARVPALAKLFRSRGIAVIESDPRTAVQVMGVPAEHTTLDHLLHVLQQFGIVSDPPLTDLSRDQTEAITSAIVGVAFWAGRFASSGDAEEGLLVVPHIGSPTSRWSNRAAIGLSGPMAAGKTTAGMHLHARGFHYARYSWIVEDVAREREREPSRSTLQDVGRELHRTRGQRWLGRKLLEKLPAAGCMVIDGLRYPDDHAFMTESFGPYFHHIAITAPVDCRRRRFETSRQAEDFQRAAAHPSELEVENVSLLAHRVIANDGSLEQFLANLEAAVDELLDLNGRAPQCM